MQAELNKVVAALREFYARETHLLEKDLGERTLTHRLGGASGKAVCRTGRSIAITTGSASARCGCQRAASSRPTIISESPCYPDIVVHQRDIPNNLLAIEVRKASNHQPLEHDRHKLRGADRPASVVRLPHRGVADACAKQRDVIGSLCRRQLTTAGLGLVRRAVGGCGIECAIAACTTSSGGASFIT